MEIDENMIYDLMRFQNSQELTFELILDGNTYSVKNGIVFNSSIPVKKPTSRGGVYFSDITAFKFRGTIDDTSITSFLSKVMLGPNTEFKTIEIKTQFRVDEKSKTASLYTNLTNSKQSKSEIELNFVIVGTNLN